LAGLAACAHVDRANQPLIGRIWDTRAGTFAPPEQLFDRAARARHVILGEIHDNPEHHQLQLVVLQALARTPRRLAMEQFDSEHQAAIDAAPRDAEALADAGRFDRKGWNWPLYRPLVQFALQHGWPIIAANLSRTEGRAIVAEPARAGLPPASATVKIALERDIIDGHCGAAPEAKRLAGMVEAQRARDARMAAVLKDRSVLIAGSGHAQRDRGVPLYLADRDVISIAFTEVESGKTAARDYGAEGYDYLWFTVRAERADPCG
jgi:uncharacterized iron-regulated protein